jgi:hypothetical protein
MNERTLPGTEDKMLQGTEHDEAIFIHDLKS